MTCPVKAVGVEACQGLAELGSLVTLKRAFQFISSGALVCPLSYLQHSASEKRSSGLVLGSWVMASAENKYFLLLFVDVVLLFWILGFF